MTLEVEVVPETTPIRIDEQAGFDSVSSGEALPEPTVPVAETAPAESEAAPTEEVVEAKPEPKTIALTEEQWAETQAKLARIDKLEESITRERTTTSGKLGEFNQALRDLKAAQGGRKLSVDQFKELAGDYPDVVKGLVEGFNSGIPEPEPVKEAEPEQPKFVTVDEAKAIKDRQELLEVKLALVAVDPNWESLTSTPQFKAWRDSHPVDVAAHISTTRDPKFLSDMLKGYKGHLKAEAEKAEKAKPKPTTQRLAAAITPTGAPPAGRTSQSERAELEKGFNSVT